MTGFIELCAAVALLLWVIGPFARWQYERDQETARSLPQEEDQFIPERSNPIDPLSSHPYHRPKSMSRTNNRIVHR